MKSEGVQGFPTEETKSSKQSWVKLVTFHNNMLNFICSQDDRCQDFVIIHVMTNVVPPR